jgi:hypothetical protein
MMLYEEDRVDVTWISTPLIDEASLETPLEKQSLNIYTAEKVGWYDIPDGSGPQHPSYTPEWAEQMSRSQTVNAKK